MSVGTASLCSLRKCPLDTPPISLIGVGDPARQRLPGVTPLLVDVYRGSGELLVYRALRGPPVSRLWALPWVPPGPTSQEWRSQCASSRPYRRQSARERNT